MHHHSCRTSSFAARFVGGLGAALILVLIVLAACPQAHEWIHGHESHAGAQKNTLGAKSFPPCTHDAADPDDDGCIITLFAHGVVSTTIFAAVAAVFFRLIARAAQLHAAPCLVAPRYRLPPLCGPPQS